MQCACAQLWWCVCVWVCVQLNHFRPVVAGSGSLGRTVSLRAPAPLAETADGCLFNRVLQTGKELQWTQMLEDSD